MFFSISFLSSKKGGKFQILIFQDSSPATAAKEYTLSLGRNHKLRRKPYSESEDYDTDTSGDTRNEVISRSAAAAHSANLQEMRNNINRYSALRYRQQFDLWTCQMMCFSPLFLDVKPAVIINKTKAFLQIWHLFNPISPLEFDL